ncbi:LysM peptidoglycan-binding domain-containing protein [Bacillus sp. 37MA]|uniref:LysM peptidoglycan-binding domain-containing protein n=1 Tax=Bacillus sp. 37MA TaxID=1132442 RepID=UPI000361E7CD|nr:LysM peptidoglycan-binding domain-containing protein [Bacillus sp. 37MA]
MIVTKKNFIYTVQKGDTLFSIASRFGSSVKAIEEANHLTPPVTDPGLIYPGNVLVVPILLESGRVSYIVKGGDTVSGIASRFSTFTDLVSGINNLNMNNLIVPDQRLQVPVCIYEIQSGDTLFAISRRFGISLSRITKSNQGRPGYQEDLIWPKFYLILPLPTSQNIVVWSPLPGAKVVSGQQVQGQARAFEATLNHELRDANGVIVSKERFTTADAGAPEYGKFRSTLPFDKMPTASTGELRVFTRSAKDGSIQDLVRMKVIF